MPGRLVLGQWALGPIYVLGSGSSGGQLLALGSGRDGQESLVTKVWAALGWRCRGLKSLHIPRVPGHLGQGWGHLTPRCAQAIPQPEKQV